MNEIVNSVATINGWKNFNKTVVRKTIAGSIKVSDPFVGGYQLIPEIKIFVSRDGNMLLAKATTQPLLNFMQRTE